MRIIREILRLLLEHGLSQRAVARACAVSPTTVGEYLELARQAGLDWLKITSLDDVALKQVLIPEGTPPQPRRPQPDFATIQQELKRKGVTLQLLWEEYRSAHPDGYGRTQFFERYRDYARTVDPVMRFTHKAGEKLFVDFSGDRPEYVNRESGEAIAAELFVAVMGASDLVFAVATPTQQTPHWLKAHVAAFEYLGGVPACVVPDQLKSAVKTSCRYDPEINPAYASLAAHYGVAVVPARPGKPRDKAKVENGVLNAQRRILAVLRNRTFFSLAELNSAIAIELERLNQRPMQGVGKSRRQLFEELDYPELKPLPTQRFELHDWKKASVNIDYHIALDRSFYSVPYTLIGKEVEVCLTATTVEVFREGERVASHARTYRRGEYVTNDAHRPAKHLKQLEWTPERLRRWGESIGPQTGAMIVAIVAGSVHAEHAYRKCLGLLRLSKTYGADRLELACARALRLKALTYQSVKNILDKGLEAAELPENQEPQLTLCHENLRGSAYYAAAGGVQ